MEKEVAWIDGWEVRKRPDGSFGVYDSHSMLDGPYGRKEEAMAAALRLPHPTGQRMRPPRYGAPVQE